jgi:hypothetical protein
MELAGSPGRDTAEPGRSCTSARRIDATRGDVGEAK